MTYRTPRFTSSVGDDQTPAPDGLHLKDPVDAARCGIESLNGAAGASHEEITSNNRQSPDRVNVTFESVRPFQLESFDLIDAQTGGITGLITSVISRGAPPILCFSGDAGQIHIAIGTIAFRRGGGGAAGNAKKRRHCFAFIPSHHRCHVHHQTEVQRADDPRRGQLFQDITRRNSRIVGIVADGASLLINRLAGNWCRDQRMPDYSNGELKQRQQAS